MLHSALINVMVKAARRAGRSLKRDLGEIENLQVSLKGPANFVSLADRRAEQMLYDDLTKARPGYGFLGEEGGTREGTDKANTWIVDPLDGTTNFLHGIPQFAISIGLQREGTIIAGVIYNPANDELYIAERGKGAFLNDQRLRVAGRKQLSECVVACGLPHIGRGDHELSRREMAEMQNRVAGLRRFGAASLDLAFVAAGRLDGYWERNLQPWDIAAGLIMVREAGGVVSGGAASQLLLEQPQFLNHGPGFLDRMVGGGDAAIDRLLQQNFLDVVRRESAFAQGRADVQAKFIPLSQRHHRADHQHAAGAFVEMRTRPDITPCVARDEIDEVGVECVLAGHRFIDPGVAEHLAPFCRAPIAALIVVHGFSQRWVRKPTTASVKLCDCSTLEMCAASSRVMLALGMLLRM